MAIVQISKLQQRSGNLVDLPQLDEAELGFASDAKLLYVGKESPAENIEVLTSYSNISFSQINGSGGNLNVDSANLANGQVLAYDGTEWTNKGGDQGGLITLGDVANVKIDGGAIGYVLETDGAGNLSWTAKTALVAFIDDVTKADPAVVTTTEDNFFINGSEIVITDVLGMTQLNGNTYYANVLTSNTFSLYTDSGLTSAVNSVGYTTYTSGGRIVSQITGGGGSGIGAAGSSGAVQYNDSGTLAGSTNFTWSNASSLLSVTGNANVTNLNATTSVRASTLFSNVATGTAPITVSSKTRVANLNVTYSNVSDFGVVTLQTTGTFYPVFVNNSATGNRALGSNASLVFNAATGNLTATILNATGNVSGGNITTGGVVTATGNVSGGNITTGGVVTATGNVSGGNITTGGVVTATGNVSGGNITTTGVVTATGNVSGANITTTGVVTATGNVSGGNITTTGVVTATGNVSGGNIVTVNTVSGTLLTGTLTTAAQPNVTSVSSSFTSLTFANAQTITGNNLSITTGANTRSGSITGNWTLTTGSRLQATYADLAEYYSADDFYQPGTVLEFGGTNEVTLATDGTNRVAGVVSTDPAYAMNAKCPGLAVALALQGRVPCKVRGKVEKGDMLISAGDGFARASLNPTIGSVIGKSLENFNGIEGVIEVAVGRL